MKWWEDIYISNLKMEKLGRIVVVVHLHELGGFLTPKVFSQFESIYLGIESKCMPSVILFMFPYCCS